MPVTYSQQSADEWYIAWPQFGGRHHKVGTRSPYRRDGHFESKAVFLHGFYGVTDRLDLGIQIPFFSQTFSDTARLDEPEVSGFSDIRFFAKWRLLQNPVIASVKTGVKLPTGNYRPDAGVIPVGEGQWDFDLVAQLGRSLWPLPLYGGLEGGYRVRLENERAFRDPGDEWLFRAELGYSIGTRALLVTKLEGVHGRTGTDFGLKTSSQIKRITYLTSTLLFTVRGGTAVEMGTRFTVNGRNFPAGHQLLVGLSTTVRTAGVTR